jgi:hypothetical protein
MAPEESLSMWRSYTDRDQGIVVQSTFARLVQSLENTAPDIFIGSVKYIDHSEHSYPELGVEFNRFLKKDKSFEYEQELRAIKWNPKSKDGHFDYQASVSREECLVEVDLSTLIEGIAVSPYMGEWVHMALRKVVLQFTPHIDLVHSGLVKTPLF